MAEVNIQEQHALLEGQSVTQTIFRAYDIRGVYEHTIIPDTMYQIGLALGSEAAARGLEQIITGRDGRLSSPILSIALQQGILASGCNVIDIGAVPTPILYYATKVMECHSGVMLTGSHNPAEYNGVKMVLDGTPLSSEEIQGLYQRIVKGDFVHGRGNIQNFDISQSYLDKITSNIKLAKPLKVVVDCGNGIAGLFFPKLLRSLGCEVIELYCDVDGHFPHHQPDPSQPEVYNDLRQALQKEKADVGLMLDGDADRLGILTNRGQIIWPDRQMMLFAKSVLEENKGATIVFDVKCSRLLPQTVIEYGGKPIMWKTGHTFIKKKLKETEAAFAGEMSGHFFFNDKWYGFDDGIYSAARFLEILAATDMDADSLFKTFPDSINTPELRVAISDEEKFRFINRFVDAAKFDHATVSTIDGLRVDFADGWGLLRASNTTPYLILRFEGDSEAAVARIKKDFKAQMLSVDNNLEILF